MKPHHHIDEATLVSYAAGALSEAFAVVVAAHLALCDVCRETLAQAEDIGGHLMRLQAGVPLDDTSLARMLARLPEAERDTTPVQPPSRHDPDVLPPALWPHFGPSYRALRWRWLGPGVHYIRGAGVDEDHLMLLRVAPGRCLPMHTHGGSELTMVLRGAYDDSLGHFAPGDVADLDSDVEHQPVTAPGVPCVCVAATDAPLRFSGWVARTLQPLFRL
jgi:putative transcriptional regulator